MEVTRDLLRTNRSVDLIILAISAIGMALSLYSLKFDDSFFGLFKNEQQNHKGIRFGQISSLGNDTRKKTPDTIEWNKIKEDQDKEINVGDSLFSGESSQAEITLNDGGTINLDANTLIHFTKIDGIQIPDINAGNVRVHVKDSFKMAIGGEITEIQGKNSDIQIFFTKDKKPSMRLLNGYANIKQKSNGKKITLNKNKLITIEQTSASNKIAERKIASTKLDTSNSIKDFENNQTTDKNDIIEQQPQVFTIQQPDIVYYYHLYDLYEKLASSIVFRKERATTFNKSVSLKWKTIGDANIIYGQTYSAPDFAKNIQNFELKNDLNKEMQIQQISIGQTFFRFSLDKVNWTKPEVFNTDATFLPEAPPILKDTPTQNKIIITQLGMNWTKHLHADSQFTSFIMESSLNADFTPETTVISLLSNNVVSIPLSSAKTQYLRFRGLNSEQEISQYSPVYILKTQFAELPKVPRLTNNSLQHEGQFFELNWDDLGYIYDIKIMNSEKKLIHQQTVIGSKLKGPVLNKGQYQVEITAFDQLGRQSPTLSTNTFVMEKPVIRKTMIASSPNKQDIISQEKTESHPHNEQRQLATTSSISQKIIEPTNDIFKSSKIQLETGLFTILSQDQIKNKKEAPQYMMIGIQATHWIGPHALEGLFKSKASSLNAQSENSSPTDLEARYLYSFDLNWNPFLKANKSTVSTVLAYESYRNPSKDQFIQQFDLAKLGIDLNFQIGKKWDTGGQVLYGVGNNKDNKQEISGRLNYYLQRNWSLGFGYKVDFYETKKPTTFSSGNSYNSGYRESQGEGFSVLRWHY